jgi:predicted O-methyltransferase YrrM
MGGTSLITGVEDAIAGYMTGLLPPETGVHARLRAETAGMPGAVMQVSQEQGRVMQMLLGLCGARRTIEIGVFTGFSTLVTAEALPADGRVIACDVSEEWTSIAQRYWQEAGVAHKIDLRIAPALQTLDALLAAGEAASFDFAFIDADKENQADYYERCLQLLRPGGLLMLDNALWHARVADPADNSPDTLAIRELNRRMAADSRTQACLIACGDGLHLARKR